MKFSRFLVAMVAAILLQASASVAAKGFSPGIKQVWGFNSGEAVFVQNFACLSLDDPSRPPLETVTAAAGWIRGLGWLAMDSSHCTPGADGLVTEGQATFTSWNGSELFATYTAETVMPPPLVVLEVKFSVLGGSGRFEDVFGTLLATNVVHAQFIDGNFNVEVPWKLRFAFAGWVSY